MTKTQVKILVDDPRPERLYRKGERGYIDGYVTNTSGTTFAVVIVRDRMLLLQPHAFKIIKRRLWR